jgi:hypothetical protein
MGYAPISKKITTFAPDFKNLYVTGELPKSYQLLFRGSLLI